MKKVNFSFVQAYVVPALVFLTIILLVPLFLIPQVARFKEKNLQVQEAQKRLDVLNKKIDALNNIDENEESQMRLEVEKSVPTSKNLPPLIVGVKNIAGKAGLQVREMNFKPGKIATQSATASAAAAKNQSGTSVKELKDRINFTAILSGSLDQMKVFLSELEKSKRLLEISSFKSTIQNDGSHKFDLLVSTPFKEVKSGGDPVGSPLPLLSNLNKKTFEILKDLVDYTSVVIPLVPTGVEDPFK